MFRRFTKKRVIVALSAIAALVVAGAAIAYWTSSGTGTNGVGTTAAGSSDLAYTTAGATNAMFPGDTAQAFTVTVTNNLTDQTAYVKEVKAYITTDKTGCTGADYLLNGDPAPSDSADAVALPGWTPQELAAAGGHASSGGTDTIQFNDKSDVDQNACKGAAVTINYVTGL